jgi:putative glycosyltransferase
MQISIVATLYQSSPHLEEFYRRITLTVAKLTDDYEIILVNDGSPDDSLERAIKISETDPKVCVVDLSRNFGHHKAMMTGLAHTQGDYIFLIDSDLEEEPEWLLSFFEQIHRDRCDVVYGVQDRRKGGFFERWSGLLFYRLFRLLTRLEMPENMVTARLMSRRYVDALLRFEEREVFLWGLWHIIGFDQRPNVVGKHSSSKSTYTLARKIALTINAITSFSNAPLVAIFYIGALISLVALVFAIYLVFNWLLRSEPLMGWTSTVISIWLIGGMIISFMGVVGIYLSKVFSETKRRPFTIVRQIYGKK